MYNICNARKIVYDVESEAHCMKEEYFHWLMDSCMLHICVFSFRWNVQCSLWGFSLCQSNWFSKVRNAWFNPNKFIFILRVLERNPFWFKVLIDMLPKNQHEELWHCLLPHPVKSLQPYQRQCCLGCPHGLVQQFCPSTKDYRSF